MINITQGKGFYMVFENGYGISVQFGCGNYCDNYDGFGINDFEENDRKCGKEGSRNAECAVCAPDGGLIDLPEEFGGDQVTNRTKPNDILKLMNWAASLPKKEV